MDRRAWSVLGTGAAAVGAAAAYATWVEPRWFALRRVDVPCLPTGTRPLRVLHLSDLHLVPRQHRKRDWVGGLAALAPDLVVHTGDHLAAQDAVPAVLETYGRLLDVPGVFVLGSNDYFAPKVKNPFRYLTRHHAKGTGDTSRLPTSDLVHGFTSRGWVDLTNRHDKLVIRGRRFDFVGVDDPHLGYDRLDLVRRPPHPSAELTIGVTHAPYQRVLDAFVEDGAGLVIAGHTHGGQVCVPGYGALVTNCDLDTSRVKGVSRWWPGAAHQPSSAAPDGAAWLEVCAGLGTSPTAPVRLACRPEAVLLTLVARG